MKKGRLSSTVASGRLGAIGLQVPQKPLKRHLIRIVLLPIAEIGDKVFPNFNRRIFASIGVEALPIPNDRKRNEADREQDTYLVASLAPASLANFCFYPLAIHACPRKNEQDAVVNANRFINLLVNLLARLDVVRCKPAAYAFVLEVSVEAFGKLLVLGRMANKTRVELYRFIQERWQVIDELVGRPPQPRRKASGSRPDLTSVWWSRMLGLSCLEASIFCTREIGAAQHCASEDCSVKLGIR